MTTVKWKMENLFSQLRDLLTVPRRSNRAPWLSGSFLSA
jgi:hypothetical protein